MANTDNTNRKALPFTPDAPMIFNLPLGAKILKGYVVLTGTVQITGETAAGTVMGEGGPVNLIKRIKITATPSAGSRYPGGDIVDCTPRALLREAIFQRIGGKYVAEQSGSTLGNGVNGTYNIYLAIPIFFADQNLRNEFATALNADPSAYKSIQVRVDGGDLGACFTGNNGTLVSGLQVQWIDDRIDIAGDTLVRYQEDHVFQIGASFTRALDQAMPQDGAFESWLFLQELSAQQVLSNLLLQRITLKAPTAEIDLYAPDIYQQMIDDGLIDAAQNQTGMIRLDFTKGALQNTIQAATINAYYAVTNVSGPYLDQLRIMTRRVVAPIPANS